MPSISSLIARLTADYPDISFEQGQAAYWSPSSRTISYTPATPSTELLHELGHALSGHTDYERDIQLIAMEHEAWTAALEIAPTYGVKIAPDTIERHMDTYRDWLHARSLCPACQANGIQVDRVTYQCPACEARWVVNEARTCALRRRQIK